MGFKVALPEVGVNHKIMGILPAQVGMRIRHVVEVFKLGVVLHTPRFDGA
jgi:hypothetical protein